MYEKGGIDKLLEEFFTQDSVNKRRGREITQ